MFVKRLGLQWICALYKFKYIIININITIGIISIIIISIVIVIIIIDICSELLKIQGFYKLDQLKLAVLTADRNSAFPEELNSDKVNPKSLLKKHLTREVFDQLKDKKTSKGSTLWDCIKTGVINLDSSVGVYAGDEECYKVFAPLINPLIEDYHSPYKLADKHTSSMNAEEVQYPDLDPDRKYIRSTRVRVARNLSGYGLPPTVTKQERLEIEKKVRSLLSSCYGDSVGFSTVVVLCICVRC